TGVQTCALPICVKFSTQGEMVLDGFFIEEIETRSGKRLKVRPLAVEPVADIAVLGCLDLEQFGKEAEAFESFCRTTMTMRLARGRIRCFRPFSVRILNADGRWISGTAELCEDSSPGIFIETDEEIKGGASGGPILN